MALHRVTYLIREVPNLDITRAFYREFGLDEREPGVFATQVGGKQLFLREKERAGVCRSPSGRLRRSRWPWSRRPWCPRSSSTKGV
jgi:hypothetical protein